MSCPELPFGVEAVFARAAAAAARAVKPLIGVGDGRAVDQAAVDAIRSSLGRERMSGRVVTGEGAKDEAPMLAAGEVLGLGGEAIDIAVDPVDGTSAVAGGHDGAIVAMGLCPGGRMYDLGALAYCERIVVACSADRVDLRFERPVRDVLADLGAALGKPVAHLRVGLLQRPRNDRLAIELSQCGVTSIGLPYADLAALGAVAVGDGRLDALVGVGGVPETIAGACAVVAGNGTMIVRPYTRDDRERETVAAAGASLDRVWTAEELVGPSTAFVASGITDSLLLPGIRSGDVSILTMVTGQPPTFSGL